MKYQNQSIVWNWARRQQDNVIEFAATVAFIIVLIWMIMGYMRVFTINVPKTSQTGSTSLTIPDSANDNSATDALQTSAGTNVFQDTSGRVQ